MGGAPSWPACRSTENPRCRPRKLTRCMRPVCHSCAMTTEMVDRWADTKKYHRSWYWYDWANSAFVTTVGTVLFGPYLTNIAQEAAWPPASPTTRSARPPCMPSPRHPVSPPGVGARPCHDPRLGHPHRPAVPRRHQRQPHRLRCGQGSPGRDRCCALGVRPDGTARPGDQWRPTRPPWRPSSRPSCS